MGSFRGITDLSVLYLTRIWCHSLAFKAQRRLFPGQGGERGVKRSESAADHTVPSGVEVKNKWSLLYRCFSTRALGAAKEILTFKVKQYYTKLNTTERRGSV